MWVVCDPSGERECMVKESHWVAKRFNTEADVPCAWVSDALTHFAASSFAHLSTHGDFARKSPTHSRLSLNKNQALYLPLWTLTAIQTEAELVMLSACESNLTGQDTEELLTPIGIGPTLAAAGAKTVVGTLWSCNGIAAMCFTQHFYQIAQQNPTMPWHQVTAQARQALREMTEQDLTELETKLKSNQTKDLCDKQIKLRKSDAMFVNEKPFEKFSMWAGFVVLGHIKRK